MDDIIHEITPLSERDFFYIVDRHKQEFNYPMHSHPEYELNFIEHGSGVTRIVGDSVETIGDYDLVLITGQDLEHVWEQGICTSPDIHEITIQFAHDSFSGPFAHKNQFSGIYNMLQRARCGLAFPMDTIMKVYNQLVELTKQPASFQSVINLLQLLNELANCPTSRQLSSSSYAKHESHNESRRVAKVQQYISDNYNNEIRLNTLADMVGMTPVAFSRFFRLRTGKTLSDYIIEYRLGKASRMLIDTQMSISEICYLCGFNTLSNFNRQFKRLKNCTPKEFRENYHKRRILI